MMFWPLHFVFIAQVTTAAVELHFVMFVEGSETKALQLPWLQTTEEEQPLPCTDIDMFPALPST